MATDNTWEPAQVPEEPVKAKNMNPGVRVVGSRVLDSENGTRCELERGRPLHPLLVTLSRSVHSCHQCRQKSLAEKKQVCNANPVPHTTFSLRGGASQRITDSRP